MDERNYAGKKFELIALLIGIVTSTYALANNKAIIDVKLGVLESLAHTGPTSSEVYKRLSESTLYYAIGENESKLRDCGYKLTPSIVHFDNLNTLELIKATKHFENSGTWLVIGPRRSSHFITTAKTLKNTPLLSTMANAEQVYNLNNISFTMYPSASTLAKLTVNEVLNKEYGPVYGTLVDVRCNSCLDFAKAFRQHNPGQKEAFYIETVDNAPDLTKLREAIAKHNIDYLLIPNYSALTGYVISQVQKFNPTIKFVGSDGWGEDSYTHTKGYGINKNTTGFAVRLGAQKDDREKRYKFYSLGREVDGVYSLPPYSAYAMGEAIRILTNDLCSTKPQNKEAFTHYLSKQSPSHFRKDNLYAVHHFQEGSLVFSHYLNPT